MRHLFVPYEIALELKAKGFDEPCLYHWERGADNHGWGLFSSGEWICVKDLITPYYDKDNNICGEFSAPLYQQVVDWFDSKNIVIIPTYSSDVWGYKILYRTGEIWNNEWLYRHQAMEAAIKEALKLI